MIQRIWKDDLFKYITGIIQNNKSKLIAINGMPDHIHIFIGYKPTIPIPELVKDIKVASSLWINENRLSKNKFAWQEGYGAFSYSQSQINAVVQYIQNQELHHQKKSFREEYHQFLCDFHVEYDDKYLYEFFDNYETGSTPTELGDAKYIIL